MQKQLRANRKPRNCCFKCFLGTFLYILALLLLVFLAVFVIAPVVFKYSPGIQRSIIFPTWYITPKNYSNIEEFKLRGVNNFYINTSQSENVTLGVWQILPEEMLSEFIPNDNYNYDSALTNIKYKILLYMHGNGADRTEAKELYEILRKNFQIFAVDYRGYGDSSRAQMTETAMVRDIVELYKWLRVNTNAPIFIWGHSLGTAIGTHLVADLNALGLKPAGLVLETPFTSVVDIMEMHPVVRIYSWLPWFKTTLITPIIDNDLNFSPKRYIRDVNCPILILHAKDDTIIPYENADTLYEIAMSQRNTTVQGNITYQLFEAVGYDHMLIFLAPQLPTIVSNFIEECMNFIHKKTQ